MKSIFLLVLVVCVHPCVAMDENFSVEINVSIRPHQLREEALRAAGSQQLSKAAAYISLSKIFTRMDASCIPGHFDHDQAQSVELFRNSRDFMRQTGPVYHTNDPRRLQSVMDAPGFKTVFVQQTIAVGRALISKALPSPEWIFSDTNFLGCGAGGDDLVAQQDWFALRLAALKTYYQDPELFPAGSPVQIILQEPNRVDVSNSWCSLL